MAILQNAFDSYDISYFGFSPTVAFTAVIQVYQSGLLVGRMTFVPDTAPLTPNTTFSPLGTNLPELHYRISNFKDIHAILRHVQPLYLYLNTVNGEGRLSTLSPVPVGQ